MADHHSLDENSKNDSASTTSPAVATLAQRRQRRSTSSSQQQQQQQQSTTTIATRKSSTDPSKSSKKPDDHDNLNKKSDDQPSTVNLSEQLKQKNCRWSLSDSLEACDIQGNWYPAKIVEIKDDKVKIHFLRWKKRYDQWFNMDTDLIRPRGDGQKISDNINNNSDLSNDQMPESSSSVDTSSKTSCKFELNEEILARWSDQKYYPAKILKFYSKGQYCLVLFYDNYRKKVKVSSLLKMPENYQGEQMPPPLSTLPSIDHRSSQQESSLLSSTAASASPINILDAQSSSSIELAQKNRCNSFVCDICQKGFRKESLLLQHKKHFHKTELDDVPSLVPPQLRVHKSSRNHDKQLKSNESSGGGDIKIKTEHQEGISDQDAAKIAPIHESLKRKNDQSTMSPSSNNINSDNLLSCKKIKSEQTDHDSTDTGSETQPLKPTTELKKSMKSLSVIIPAWSSRRPTKPNTVLPFKDAKQEAEEHENDNIEEFVKCICPLEEESGLMVQCELCLAWQHGSCAGFHSENDVPPSGYFCQFCRQAPKSVRTQRNSYQLNHWLKNGQPPQFSPSMFGVPNESRNNNNQLMNKFISDPMMKFIEGQHQQSSNESKTYTLHDLTLNQSTASAQHNNNNDNFINEHSHHLLSSSNTTTATAANAMIKNENYFNDSNYMYNNNNTNTNIDDNDGSGYYHFHHHHHRHMDSDPEDNDDDIDDLHYMRITNQLSSALYDCMVNLHSLNYRIKEQQETLNDKEILEIEQKQQELLLNMDSIQQKLDKIEKDIEQKDQYAIHTSSSTLSATSPENFGIQSDCGIVMPGLIQSSASVTPVKSNLFGLSNSGNNFGEITDQSVISENANNQDQSSNSQQPPIARLVLTTTGNDNNNSATLSNQNDQHRLHHHTSMAHDFLPVNLTDSEMKLELACHYRDLQIAREIVLLSGSK